VVLRPLVDIFGSNIISLYDVSPSSIDKNQLQPKKKK
jgi:hypothetical protein